jgi:hypothetical protein
MDRSKPHAQVFVLFPETEPQHPFIKRNEGFQDEEELNNYFNKFILSKKAIAIENYWGYYDSENVKQYLKHYKILEDCYPTNPSRVIGLLLKDWENWRSDNISILNIECILFYQSLFDNTFCKLAHNKLQNNTNKYVLASHEALVIPLIEHEVNMLGQSQTIFCHPLSHLPLWFVENRIPKRIYHPSPKHGENGIGEYRDAAKLLCSHIDAEKMLQKAIGLNGMDELYYYDTTHQKYIIFRYEGDIPQNQFHAYHIANDNDVPKEIKEMHCKLHELEI